MIVLDASVAAKCYLEEAGSDEAIALLTSETKLLAPELIRLEVCSALCRRVRRGELGGEEARVRCQHWLERLRDGLIELTPDRDLLSESIVLANQFKHALQDCLYLAVARRFDVPLITADRTFTEKFANFDSRISLLVGCGGN
jgi:predicted nucleic acid-binding protein